MYSNHKFSEKFIIGKIKIISGYDLTTEMETMVMDLDSFYKNSGAGSDFTEVFQSTFLDPKKSGSEAWKGDEFKVKMLTLTSWPTYHNPPDIIVPVCIQQAIDHHHQFYKSFELHQNRKPVWSHLLGGMQLAFKPKNKKYKITMTPMQAYVCLLFSSFDEKLTFKQLNEMLNLDGEQGKVAELSNTKKLKTMLGSLMSKKILVCYDKKGKKTKRPKIDGSFTPNAKFKSDKLKFDMPKPKFDSEKVVRKVKEDRFEGIDSCLVRIMKARTELTQKILIAESMNQLSNLFKVDRRAIKKRIDVLIDGEYFGRDEEDPNLLLYLA